MTVRIWQEYDCPECLIDFDLLGEKILAVGEECYCSGCGGSHKAGPQDVISETYVLDADDQMQVRGLPADAAEKAAWIAEASQPPHFELVKIYHGTALSPGDAAVCSADRTGDAGEDAEERRRWGLE